MDDKGLNLSYYDIKKMTETKKIQNQKQIQMLLILVKTNINHGQTWIGYIDINIFFGIHLQHTFILYKVVIWYMELGNPTMEQSGLVVSLLV